ncbi:MAG: putative ABC transporter permease [Bacilli bacterium]
MYYLICFFLYAILGHGLEIFLFNKSGILLSYWTPIYGLGAVIIIFIYNFINKKWSLSKVTKFFIIFLIGFLLLSFIEALGGYLIEYIFHITFWDYSAYKFNIGKYIALEMALIWGLCSILLVCFLKPLTDKIIKYIPNWAIIILIFIFIWDIILTFIIKH